MDAWGFVRPDLWPGALFLAAISAVLVVSAALRSRRSPGTSRRVLAAGCRLLTLALLVLMMSAPTLRQARPKVPEVAFVVDPAERLDAVRAEAYGFIGQVVESLPSETLISVQRAPGDWLATPGSRAGDVSPRRWADGAEDPLRGRYSTAVEQGARHLTPGDVLVLFTDGRSDPQALLTTARHLRQKGVRTYLYELSGSGRSGVFLDGVTGPVLVREGDRATFRAAFWNLGSEAVPLDLSFELREEAGGGASSAPLPPVEGFVCGPGRCVVEYPVLFPRPGDAWVGVTLRTGEARRRDGELREAWFPCMVRPTPEILLVSGTPGAADHVLKALRLRGAEISGHRLFETDPAGIPDDAEALRRYGAVVLVNVEAGVLTSPQTDALRRYVEELGGGLVAFGGIQAFDRGGYAGSALEELLPVDSLPEPPERRGLSFGLLFVIDVSGSVAGSLGETKASIEKLVRSVPLDSTIGIVLFDGVAQVDRGLAQVGSAQERDQLLRQVGSLAGGGGTVLSAGLEAAVREVAAFEARAPKGHTGGHVLVLSDGEMENGGYNNPALENLRRLARKLMAKGWPVSCVGIGGSPDLRSLAQVAAAGGGHISAYPLIPRIGSDKEPDEQLTYTLSTTPGEPLFRLDNRDPLPLGSVTDFNRAKGLKPWGHESLRFDHGGTPWGLAFGRLGRGTSVAALYDATSTWSFPLLAGKYRDTLLARPVLFSLGAEMDELVVPTLREEEDGRWVLFVETADDAAAVLEVRLSPPPEDGAERTPLILALPRIRRHVYRATVPAGAGLAETLRLDIAPRPERGGSSWRPAVRVPVSPRHRVDIDTLRGGGPDREAIAEILLRAGATAVQDPSDVKAGGSYSPPEARRFWNPWLALAVVLAVAADAAARTWRLGWPLGLYAAASGLAFVAWTWSGGG